MKVKDIIKLGIYKIFLQPINWLLSLLFSNFQKKHDHKILVYSVMPPAKTGMASFALKIFNKQKNFFLIINKFNNIFEYLYAIFYEKQFNSNIFDISFDRQLIKKFTVDKKIFVIGNSSHHNETFRKAVLSKGETDRYLYLGENLLITPALNYLKAWKKEAMENVILKYYNKKINVTFTEDINIFWIKNKISGLKIIKELTGINKFIVFNENAKELFNNEFSQEELNEIEIISIKPPVEDLTNIIPIRELSYHSRDYKLVGSFGLPQAQKSTDDIIEAVNLLNNKGIKTKLLLAGYDINTYLNTLEINKENIIVYEKPSSAKFLSLMKAVDTAIQLRPNNQGETSGCISELLGMRQKIITTKGFVTNGLEKFCINVEPYISPQRLADVIIETLNSKDNSYNYDTLREYSFSNAAYQIKEQL